MASTATAAEGGHITGFGTKGYRAYVLGALLLAYIFNFIDRIMIGILAEPIIETFQLKDWQFGLLSGLAFATFYTFLGIPMARLSEKVSRTLIIGCAILLWSAMTALCGLSSYFGDMVAANSTAFTAAQAGFWILFIFRLGVGVGEAGLTPPANSLIADYFAPKARAQALAIYAMGITIGTFFANLFVGLTGAQVSWQQTFIIIGLAGIPVGLLILFGVREAPRGYSDPPGTERPKPGNIWNALKSLEKNPTFWLVTIGAMLASFVGYGMGNFIISFLVRNHGISVPDAALYYMAPLSLAGAVGTYACGFLTQRIGGRSASSGLWLTAISLVVASLAYMAAFNIGVVALIFPFLLLANLFHYWYLGPMYSTVAAVVDARMRATAVAILLFVVNLLGYGLGPLFVGFLSDRLAAFKLANAEGLTLDICKGDMSGLAEAQVAICNAANADGLRLSITITVGIFLIAALLHLIAMKTLKRDLVSG